MQRFDITVTVRMAKPQVHNSGWIISVEKIGYTNQCIVPEAGLLE